MDFKEIPDLFVCAVLIGSLAALLSVLFTL
jgi:hypothetical protein